MAEYHPISAKDQSRFHHFGKEVLPGIFSGYELYAGGSWKGDILLADIEELENLDASESHARRLSAKEITMVKTFVPIEDGTVKVSGGHQGIRKSSLTWDHPKRGEALGDDLRGELVGSQWIDTLTGDREARNDFLVDRREVHSSSSR